MRDYGYLSKWEKLHIPDIVALLSQIHEYKGEQALLTEAKADTLTQLEMRIVAEGIKKKNQVEFLAGAGCPDNNG